MEKKIKMLPCMMPNFLPVEGQNMRIPVKDLSETEAVEYGELMKQTFIKHWYKKITNGKS